MIYIYLYMCLIYAHYVYVYEYNIAHLCKYSMNCIMCLMKCMCFTP